MNSYKSTEYGWMFLSVFIPIQLFIVAAWIFQWGSKPIGTIRFLIIMLIFAGTVLAFYKMKIVIEDKLIHILYGIGLFHFKINLDSITSIKIVKNPWYYGAGIHFIPNGILYNIHSLNSVELTFNNKPTIVRIGAKDPLILKKELESKILFQQRS